MWQIVPKQQVVYAGVEPSALFQSTDGGRTFELVRALSEHPRKLDARWRRDDDPHDPPAPDGRPEGDRPMSTGGLYRTEDGGKSWNAANHGVRADFLPGPFPQYGQGSACTRSR